MRDQMIAKIYINAKGKLDENKKDLGEKYQETFELISRSPET